MEPPTWARQRLAPRAMAAVEQEEAQCLGLDRVEKGLVKVKVKVKAKVKVKLQVEVS